MICRFNDTILREAMIQTDKGKRVYIEGGASSINLKYIEDVYRFYAGYRKPYIFRGYSSFSHFSAYSRKIEDTAAMRAIRFCKEYPDTFLDKIKTMKKFMTTSLNRADVAYTTGHKAKGMTIKIPVIVSEDFYDVTVEDPLEIDIPQELNCLYVALTRSNNDVQMPLFLQQYRG